MDAAGTAYGMPARVLWTGVGRRHLGRQPLPRRLAAPRLHHHRRVLVAAASRERRGRRLSHRHRLGCSAPTAIGHELGSFEETSELARTTPAQRGRPRLPRPRRPGHRRCRAACRSPASRSPSPACSPPGSSSGRGGPTAPSRRSRQRRAVIFGAGSGGRILVQSLVRDPASSLVPVALLDDDPRKARLLHRGRPGARDARTTSPRSRNATAPTPWSSPSRAPPRTSCASSRPPPGSCGLEVLVLPPVREIFGGRPTESDLRNLDVADLLGRQPVDLDMAAIADQIAGRRVLVTGAGGSIGSELCRQISAFGPARLLMLDRDESGLHGTQLSLEGRALLDSDELVAVRHPRRRRRCARSSSDTRPEVVFHAAALKHLTMLERHPGRGVQDQRRRHPQRARGGRGRRGRDLRQHLHRQGGPADLRARLVQAGRRAAHRGLRRARRVAGTSACASATCSAPAARSCRRSWSRSSEGGRSPSPTPTSSATSCSSRRPASSSSRPAPSARGGEVMVLDMGSPVKIVDVARTMIDLSGRTRRRHRLHRPAPRREAHRGAVHPRRAGAHLDPPPDLPRQRPGAGRRTPARRRR